MIANLHNYWIFEIIKVITIDQKLYNFFPSHNEKSHICKHLWTPDCVAKQQSQLLLFSQPLQSHARTRTHTKTLPHMAGGEADSATVRAHSDVSLTERTTRRWVQWQTCLRSWTETPICLLSQRMTVIKVQDSSRVKGWEQQLITACTVFIHREFLLGWVYAPREDSSKSTGAKCFRKISTDF